MAWYPDLSPYGYMKGRRAGMLNVGWLERHRPYATGLASPEVLPALQRLALNPQNLSRGFHVCDLCDRPSRLTSVGQDGTARDAKWETEFYKWSEGRRGNGEIHLKSRSGDVFAAPLLVVHYVEAHGYLPPLEFIQAALAGIPGEA